MFNISYLDIFNAYKLFMYYCYSEWVLNKRIISLKIINTPHNGKNITTLINDEIIDLGIHDKIFTITLDNVYNDDETIQRLKRF